MSTEQQAKNGFKTFLVTLIVSLVLFGGIYYLLTGFSTDVDIEDSSSSMGTTKVIGKPSNSTEDSVFNQIAQAPVGGRPGTVLSGTDQTQETTGTTESTVPVTGSDTLLGVTMAVASFSAVAYLLFLNPRKLALNSFERDITR